MTRWPVSLLAAASLAFACGAPTDPAVAPETSSAAGAAGESGGAVAIAIAAGAQRSCAVALDGRVACWGRPSDPWQTELVLVPTIEDGVSDARQVVVGFRHACALTATGVYCWGRGPVVDAEDTETLHAPERVELDDVAELVSGYEHVCARTSAGVVSCWGANQRGQLGTTDYESGPLPRVVSDLDDVVLLAAGSNNSCAARGNGEVVCWGTDYLPLGDYAVNTPKAIAGLADPVSIAVGEGHVCAAQANGELAGWGRNTSLQAGAPESVREFQIPATVDGLEPVELVAAGTAHTCVTQAGTVSCWGKNAEAELGIDRRSDPIAEPQAVLGLSEVTQLVAGDFHTCVLLASQQIRCWGNNEWGQLGDGTDDTGFLPTSPMWPDQ